LACERLSEPQHFTAARRDSKADVVAEFKARQARHCFLHAVSPVRQSPPRIIFKQ
jgi:hypothetical protein